MTLATAASRPGYEALIAAGAGDPFDRHVFACVLSLALSDGARPPNEMLGLDGRAFRGLVGI